MTTTIVLGGTGLLGQAVTAEGRRRGYAVRTVARHQADLTLDIGDTDALSDLLESERPTLVVNCAALVDIAACERDSGSAYRINAAPVATLARWAGQRGGRLIHISTDHLFAGGGPEAHDEDAPVTLFNQYAATKFAAERFALLAPTALVLRTSIVGIRGRPQPTFAEWAIDAILNDRAVTLFEDAYTSSIDVGAFATAAFDLADSEAAGLLNLASREIYSKAAFVRRLAVALDRPLSRATSGSVTALMPVRPGGLGLDVARAHRLLARQLPDLAAVVRAVVDAYRNRA